MKQIEDKSNPLAVGLKLERRIEPSAISNILPDDFNFIYIYVDMNTEEVAYIGRVDSPRRAGLRLHDHRCEKWYRDGEYAIAYIPCLNRYESETLETILISRYQPKNNKDKKDWGRPINDRPLKGFDDINNLTFVQERRLSCGGVEGSLTDLQGEVKRLMVKSGEWEEAEAV